MPYNGKNDLRCPVCLRESTFAELAKIASPRGCPYCGTLIPYLQIRHDGYIRMNWQDLRVLVLYASRWAAHFDMRKPGDKDALFALQNIILALKRFKPPDAVPLMPSLDIVTTHGLPLMLDETASLKPNAEGKIPSPYYQRGFGGGEAPSA